ncbi:hypothetical protein C8R44DRAFT_91367 [Mycena epipterygia]|nr:hypothetical protein C8R44DRAFT_91367 [Mycena epipterygia]
MGRRDEQLVALIAERDAEIDNLRLSLEAHIAHALGAKSRLALALDALDSVQALRASELAAEAEAKDHLRAEMARYSERLKVTEIERDVLHHAVLEFVEKVESSKDGLPPLSNSKIKIPCLLDPIEGMLKDASSIAAEDTQWAYASGMILSLRSSLTCERHAHAETRRSARARISRLEAQLARREAELEACVMHVGQAFPRASTSSYRAANIPALPPSPPPMPISNMKAFLERTSAHNIILEEELNRLNALLEARLTSKESVPSSQTYPTLSRLGADDPAASTSQNITRRRRHAHSDTVERHRQRSSSRRGRSISPPRPQRPVSSEPLDPDRTIRPAPALPRRASTEDMHTALNRELAMLGSKIDAFHIEKETLMAQVQAESRPEPDPRSNPHRHLNRHHREDQRDQFEHRARHAQSHFPAIPTPRHGGQTAAAYLGPPSQAHLLEDYDGEMSMDLATPIYPTLMLPVAGPSRSIHLPAIHPPPTPSRPSAEISPLDLTSEHPLPLVTSPPDGLTSGAHNSPQLPPGERAVQELMTLVTAARQGS